MPDSAQAAIAQAIAGIEEDDAGHTGVWPDNWPAVVAFLAVQTQWRAAIVGGGFSPARLFYVGLDYAGVRAGLAAEGIALTPAQWRDLRLMEAEARKVLNG